MRIHQLFFEPEIQSIIFVTTNVIISILNSLLCRSWPLPWYGSCFYLLLVFLINHALSAGRHYWPIKDLRGQTVIVTGAATGIGRVCALQFAKLGARVILGIRGQERAERIANELSTESHGGVVIGHDLDLSSLANVKNFAEKIDRVDILLNNAGLVQGSYSLTTDGMETTFQTNHLGHFYLTQLLLPLLEKSRVINVSSIVHYSIKSADLDYSFSELKTNYNGYTSYAFSKLAQIYHASELTRRYGIKAYSLHPGTIVGTDLKTRQQPLVQFIIRCLFFVSKTIEQGAMTSLYCALSDDAKPGRYHSDCQVREASTLALDPHRAEECWSESERLINEKIK